MSVYSKYCLLCSSNKKKKKKTEIQFQKNIKGGASWKKIWGYGPACTVHSVKKKNGGCFTAHTYKQHSLLPGINISSVTLSEKDMKESIHDVYK